MFSGPYLTWSYYVLFKPTDPTQNYFGSQRKCKYFVSSFVQVKNLVCKFLNESCCPQCS